MTSVLPRATDLRERSKGIDVLGPAIPAIGIVLMYTYLSFLNPRAFSYLGVDLILGSAVPLVLAAISQAFIIVLGDIDLGVGFFIGLSNAIVAVILSERPLLGAAFACSAIVGYGLMGAVISFRRVSSITFTLGASFVWLGLARLIAPTPQSGAPGWLGRIFSYRPPVAPLAVWLIVASLVAAYLIFYRTRVGLLVRSAGSSEQAFVANGGSMLKARIYGYSLAGAFAVLSGVALTGLTRSADVTASADFTLLTIAAVILGGGAFTGGRVSAAGTVAGALVFSLVTALMTQLAIGSAYQVGARGLALVFVIAARHFLSERTRR